jgi:uncharacterized protein (DUF2147 family)
MTTNNFTTRFLKISALMLSCFMTPFALANSPVGQWHTSDEKTGELKSMVIIFEQQGVMKGRVEKVLRKDADPAAKCDKCSDDRKNQPIIGMEIIRGAKKVPSKNVWEDGEILDPENGKTYTLRLTPMEGGSKLEVRGFLGLLWRNQTWTRVPSAN